ncbi:MAG: DUF4956 domain-containing protein [Lachnospiraceae bacterium]|nr:DUF4956 domain-containing protein [Lachnospiraceae bacterium]
MSIKDVLQKTFIEGYASMNLTISDMIICMLCTAIIGIYIFMVYKGINKNSFYNKNFNISLIALAVITAAIILTIQSNIIVSLGMVGALSIVRFRTAVKDPMDLVFLFWAISVGIICGAGFALISIMASIVVSIVIIVQTGIKDAKGAMILIINANSYEHEDEIMQVVDEYAEYSRVKARNVTQTDMNMAIEIKCQEEKELIAGLMGIDGILSASIVDHEGDVTL